MAIAEEKLEKPFCVFAPHLLTTPSHLWNKINNIIIIFIITTTVIIIIIITIPVAFNLLLKLTNTNVITPITTRENSVVNQSEFLANTCNLEHR